MKFSDFDCDWAYEYHNYSLNVANQLDIFSWITQVFFTMVEVGFELPKLLGHFVVMMGLGCTGREVFLKGSLLPWVPYDCLITDPCYPGITTTIWVKSTKYNVLKRLYGAGLEGGDEVYNPSILLCNRYIDDMDYSACTDEWHACHASAVCLTDVRGNSESITSRGCAQWIWQLEWMQVFLCEKYLTITPSYATDPI